MAISTSDIVTSSLSTDDTINNGNAIVHCTKGGLVQNLTTYEHSTLGFSGIETKYTDRFDDIAYYNTTSGIDGGGA